MSSFFNVPMKKESPTHYCPSEALKLLGDYVTLRVIDTLRTREFRFRELKRALEEVNQVTLIRRLKVMEQAGIIERKEETIDRQSVTYAITPMGKGLLPVLQEIMGFSKKFKIA